MTAEALEHCDECDRPGLIVYRGRRLCSDCALDAIDALTDDLADRYADWAQT